MNKNKIIIITAIILCLVIPTYLAIFADGSTPGSEQDPIITLGYLNKVSADLRAYTDAVVSLIYQDIATMNASAQSNAKEIETLKQQLDEKNQELSILNEKIIELENNNNTAQTAVFEVLLLKKGTTLEAGKGTEIITRSGECSVISSINGGMADTTIGKDLKQNETAPLNHLLIASRDDGRGIKALEDSYIIIKGSYILK